MRIQICGSGRMRQSNMEARLPSVPANTDPGEATETGCENYKRGGKDGVGLPSCGQGWVAGPGDG